MKEHQDKRIRMGKIDYTNVWPVFFHLSPDILRQEIEMIEHVPSGLNAAMARGEIDMGAISSFAYGENFQEYVLFPGLSVSAYGKVGSILLFYKKPFARVLNGTIAISTASATSANLLRIIIQKFYGGNPTYHNAQPDLHEMMEHHDAALLIGDDAIRSQWTAHGYEVLDLGAEWKRWTGRWMTFAVWAIRKQAAEDQPERMQRLFAAFQESKRYGLTYPEAMIAEAKKRIGGNATFWRHYFAGLCYDFGSEQQEGLQLYYQYANELGLLNHQVHFKIWQKQMEKQVKQ